MRMFDREKGFIDVDYMPKATYTEKVKVSPSADGKSEICVVMESGKPAYELRLRK